MTNIGAVAMIDALGWRGIWKRNKIEQLASNVQAIEAKVSSQADAAATRALASMQEAMPGFMSLPRADVRFLSDTVVVAITFDLTTSESGVPGLEANCRRWACNAVVGLVAQVIRDAATVDPPIIYRGAIATGGASLHGNTLLGEAIDRAAELMNLPDGPFVWLDPVEPDYGDIDGMIDFEIPLRDGRKAPAKVVNALAACESWPRVNKVLKGFYLALADDGGSLDVVIKRKNAEPFMSKCASVQQRLLTAQGLM